MKMFEDTAREIFEEAGVDPALEPEWFQQAQNILATKMATLSGLGMSLERVDLFNKQKQSLVEDLKKFKAEGICRTSETELTRH